MRKERSQENDIVSEENDRKTTKGNWEAKERVMRGVKGKMELDEVKDID